LYNAESLAYPERVNGCKVFGCSNTKPDAPLASQILKTGKLVLPQRERRDLGKIGNCFERYSEKFGGKKTSDGAVFRCRFPIIYHFVGILYHFDAKNCLFRQIILCLNYLNCGAPSQMA
jgi:hypothetical protein